MRGRSDCVRYLAKTAGLGMLLRNGKHHSKSGYCLEDVSKHTDMECEKGSSPVHLDGSGIFKRSDGRTVEGRQ